MLTVLFLIALVMVAAIVWVTLESRSGAGARRRPEPGWHRPRPDDARLETAEELGGPVFPRGKVAPPHIRWFRPTGAAAAGRAEAQADEEGLVVLVRNPRSLYVYWDVDTPQERRLRAMLGEDQWHRTTPCLRVFDVTGDSLQSFEGHTQVIDLPEGATYAFITQGLQPGRRYMVSLARRTPDGIFYMIHHSDPVTMPHDTPEEEDYLYRLYGRQPASWSGSPWR
ncbi:MAG TPA: DUF4912 domain-containing protein [Symbiobacteriaceae bacterium]